MSIRNLFCLQCPGTLAKGLPEISFKGSESRFKRKFGKRITGLSSGQTYNPVIFSSSVNSNVGRQHFLCAFLYKKPVKLLLDTGSQINLLNKKFVPDSVVIQKNL